jgi:hypothetical protein
LVFILGVEKEFLLGLYPQELLISAESGENNLELKSEASIQEETKCEGGGPPAASVVPTNGAEKTS